MSNYLIQDGERGDRVRDKLNRTITLNNALSKLGTWIFGSDWVAKTKYKTTYISKNAGYTLLDEQTFNYWASDVVRMFDLGYTAFLIPATQIGKIALLEISKQGFNLVYPNSTIDNTFSRGNAPEDSNKSGAYEIDENGIFQSLSLNQPRWTYYTGGQTNSYKHSYLSLLKLNKNSAEFSNVLNAFTATLTPTAETNLLGTNNGVQLAEFNGGGVRINENITFTPGETWYGGHWLKFNNEPIELTLVMAATAMSGSTGTFSFDRSGVPSVTGDVNYIYFGNGFYFVYLTIIPILTGATRVNFTSSSGSVLFYESYYSQNIPNLGSFLPTNGSSLTRQVDNSMIIDNLIANYPNIGSTKGVTISVLYDVDSKLNSNEFFDSIGSTTDNAILYMVRARLGGITLRESVGGSGSYPSYNSVLPYQSKISISIDFESGDILFYGNGKEVIFFNDPEFIGEDFDGFSISTVGQGKLEFLRSIKPSASSRNEMIESTSWVNHEQMFNDLGFTKA